MSKTYTFTVPDSDVEVVERVKKQHNTHHDSFSAHLVTLSREEQEKIDYTDFPKITDSNRIWSEWVNNCEDNDKICSLAVKSEFINKKAVKKREDNFDELDEEIRRDKR